MKFEYFSNDVEQLITDYFIYEEEDSKYMTETVEELEGLDEADLNSSSDPAQPPSICVIDYCSKEAGESGFCDWHKHLGERGFIFKTWEQEYRAIQKTKKKEKTGRCILPSCRRLSKGPRSEFCSKHNREIRKYGHTITDGSGFHRCFVNRRKRNGEWIEFAEVLVFRHQTREFVSLILDYPIYNIVKRRKVYFKNNGHPWIEIDGKKVKIANYVLGLDNRDIIDYNNKNIYDLRKENLKPWEEYINTFLKKHSETWLRNHTFVTYDKSKRMFKVLMFHDIPDSRICRNFKTKKEAKRFRNVVLKAVYGKNIFTLMSKYRKGHFK